MNNLEKVINDAFENRTSLSPKKAPAKVKAAVQKALALRDAGKARVAERCDGQWVVNEWLKKAVLLSFRLTDNGLLRGGETNYWDKVPTKFSKFKPQDFRKAGFRVVP